MKTNQEIYNLTQIFKGSKGNKGTSNYNNPSINHIVNHANGLMKNVSHQASSSGSKFSFLALKNNSLETMHQSPFQDTMKYNMTGKQIKKKKLINDKNIECSIKQNHPNINKNFINTVRKSVEPISVEAKTKNYSNESKLIKKGKDQSKVISNFYTYSKLSHRNEATINKYSTNITSLNNQSIEKLNEFSKIHEKLTKKITEIKAAESSVEVINSMSETYLNSLSELMLVVDTEISSIMNVIYSGLKTSFEIFNKKMSQIPEYSNKIKKLTKKSTEMQEKLQKANDQIIEQTKTIKEKDEKINHLECEINNLKKEFKMYKDKDKDKEKNVKDIKRKQKQSMESDLPKDEVDELKKELHVHKKRENKLIYFYNLLEEKGYPVKEIYENQIKSITTERFTSNGESDSSNEKEDQGDKIKSDKSNKLGFTPILNLSNISPKSSENKDKFDIPTEIKNELQLQDK